MGLVVTDRVKGSFIIECLIYLPLRGVVVLGVVVPFG